MTGGNTHHYTTATSRYWVQGPMLLFSFSLLATYEYPADWELGLKPSGCDITIARHDATLPGIKPRSSA